MSPDFLALAGRLERAQALQNERFNQAAGGRSLRVGGGFAHFRGTGHPLNQALGLLESLTDADLQAIEAFLGFPTVLELSPAADPSLWPTLAGRGYALQQFQQMWVRTLEGCDTEPAAPAIRMALPTEADLFNRVVCAGFMEQDRWETLEPPFTLSLEVPDAHGFLAFVEGQPAGGGMLGMVDGVALLSGDAVLPRFRGRGLQKALIRARLALAGARACELAGASTAPGTASQFAYEACGFRVAYPKVEMVKTSGLQI